MEGVVPDVFDPSRVSLTGENLFVRLADLSDRVTSRASFWRMIFSTGGPGRAPFVRSELTADEWRIYSDNIAMTRWLQSTVQRMLSGERSDLGIPVVDADFEHRGGIRSFWTERVTSDDDDTSLTWREAGEGRLRRTCPFDALNRSYGVSSVLIPCAGVRLALNGEDAAGQPFPRDCVAFSSRALALSESWTERR